MKYVRESDWVDGALKKLMEQTVTATIVQLRTDPSRKWTTQEVGNIFASFLSTQYPDYPNFGD